MAKSREEYNAYMKDYMNRRYQQRRDVALSLLGGKCVKCGTTQGLELDHIDRETKLFTLAKSWNVPMERFLSEVRKCQLLCDPCHNQKTLREKGQLPANGTHGTLSAIAYCKPICDLCRTVRNKWNREWKAKRRGTVPKLSAKHGEQRMYQRGCRCDLCRAANTRKARKFRESKMSLGSSPMLDSAPDF